MRQKIGSISQCWRLPAACVLCNHYHREKYAVCQSCSRFLVQIKHGCSTCRLPLDNEEVKQCGYCIKKKPAYDRLLTAYSFEEPLRALLHEFKYREALYLRSFMAKLMLDAKPAEDYQPDFLVPIPMHPARLRERGFNQAAELTKILARQLNIPSDLTLCEKTINTTAQVHLGSKHRNRNLQKAFIAKPCSFRHITLVDDLLTTGSTANALALALKKQGVATVDIWCLARTPVT